MATQLRGLGKGIEALIPEQPQKEEAPPDGGTSQDRSLEEVTWIPLESIQTSRFQPRKRVDESSIQELANSIRESGLIYPLLVRKSNKSGEIEPKYEVVAGERRFRALKQLGEVKAPVIVKDLSDRKALELSLIENLQREELNPIEQASGYQRLASEFGLSQEQIAQTTGKDRATVANTIRLLKLAPSVQQEVIQGKISLGHARALLALESEASQSLLAQQIVKEGLSVRQVEQRVKTLGHRGSPLRTREGRDPHLAAAEQRLQRALGTKVQILHGRSRGWIRIAYYSLKDLDRLLGLLTAR